MTAETIIDDWRTTEAEGADILYRSDAIEVRRAIAGPSPVWAVTFESYHDDAGFGRSGFGEAFLAREGISAIHVLTAGNDWYQYPEMDAALAAIRAALAQAAPARVMAYGSSMGGYAAIRFADAIGATHVLALSPQYSIDRRRMPAERRWYNHQNRIAFRPDYNGPIRCQADVVVAYDPEVRLDAAHVALIRRDVAITELRLPHSGHPVAPFLQEVDLLQPLARGHLGGHADTVVLEALAAERRSRSVTWMIERSSYLSGDRGTRGLALARSAAVLAPDNPTALHQYGLRLHEAGDYRTAIEQHRRAVAIMPHPQFRIALSRALFFAGEHAGALALAEQIVRAAPYEHAYVRWQGWLRAKLGDHEAAAADYATVLRLRPSLRALAGVAWRQSRRGYERAKQALGLNRAS